MEHSARGRGELTRQFHKHQLVHGHILRPCFHGPRVLDDRPRHIRLPTELNIRQYADRGATTTRKKQRQQKKNEHYFYHWSHVFSPLENETLNPKIACL